MRGDVVVVLFPFTDLSGARRRPALVVAELEGDDVILCQVTGQPRGDKYAVSLTDDDFEAGALLRTSRVRTNRVFTADRRIILYKVGHIKPGKTEEIVQRIVQILKCST